MAVVPMTIAKARRSEVGHKESAALSLAAISKRIRLFAPDAR